MACQDESSRGSTMEALNVSQQDDECVVERYHSFVTEISYTSLKFSKREYKRNTVKIDDMLATASFESFKWYVVSSVNSEDNFSRRTGVIRKNNWCHKAPKVAVSSEKVDYGTRYVKDSAEVLRRLAGFCGKKKRYSTRCKINSAKS